MAPNNDDLDYFKDPEEDLNYMPKPEPKPYVPPLRGAPEGTVAGGAPSVTEPVGAPPGSEIKNLREWHGGTEEKKPLPGFTNDYARFKADPENWVYIPDMDKPGANIHEYFLKDERLAGRGLPSNAKGEVIGPAGEGYRQGKGESALLPGEYSLEAAKIMFPDLFPAETMLDPAERVKMERGEPYDANKTYIPENTRGPVVRPGTVPVVPTREQMSANIMRNIGGNPFTANPYDIVNRQLNEKVMQNLFEKTFGFDMSQLHTLTKAQQEQWVKAQQEIRKELLGRAKYQVEQMKASYTMQMAMFERNQQEMMAEHARQQQEQWKREREAGRLTANEHTGWSPTRNAVTYWRYNPETGKSEDTLRLAGPMAITTDMPPDVASAYAMAIGILKLAGKDSATDALGAVMLMYGSGNKALAEKSVRDYASTISEDSRKAFDNSWSIVLDWMNKKSAAANASYQASQGQASQTAQKGQQTQQSTRVVTAYRDEEIAEVVSKIQRGADPEFVVPNLINRWKKAENTLPFLQQMLQEVNDMLVKIGRKPVVVKDLEVGVTNVKKQDAKKQPETQEENPYKYGTIPPG